MIKIDKYITSLKGIRNGDATSIAIISLPSGNALSSGTDNKLYISPENGMSKTKITNTKSSILVNRPLSSSRWGINELLF